MLMNLMNGHKEILPRNADANYPDADPDAT